jgi:AP-4 complex subunit beta-1
MDRGIKAATSSSIISTTTTTSTSTNCWQQQVTISSDNIAEHFEALKIPLLGKSTAITATSHLKGASPRHWLHFPARLTGQVNASNTTNHSRISYPIKADTYVSFGTMSYASSYPSSVSGAPPPYPSGATPYPAGAVSPTNISTVQGAQPPDSYFTETRKGEVNELRNLLRNFGIEKDPQRKRDIIKKVIAYMTLGIDVSRLFSEMMLVIETRDLVIKKMVYLFLCNYATTNPQLAQMCTNTLQKDCSNEDPMVRGLALRALCSLNLPEMVEYISDPLRKALQDHHAYVRKTGVMGILKLYHLDREAFERCNFIDILYDMLRDSDASVVSNCIIVLEEIMAKSEDGGMAINRAIMLHLLNRIHEFSEFGVLAILDLVPRYQPVNADEMFQIMNLLDPVFRTNNASAVMATIKAFLSLAHQNNDQEMVQQIIVRVKAPILTLASGGCSELAYTLYKHVDLLINISPRLFDDEYRQFYIKTSEPTYNKYLKMQLLAKVASPYNAQDIVAELCENTNDVDKHLARLAIQGLAVIACSNSGGEGCSEAIVQKLVEFLETDIPHVSAESANALKDILRKHPSLGSMMIPPLPRAVRYIDDPQGKASVIWLLGELGDFISEAPYALEKLIDKYDTISEPLVKIALLTSTMKLFFKRPPEVQKMLGRLLKSATDDVSSQDLHDRALFYHRLMRASPKTAQMVVTSSSPTLPMEKNFSEYRKSEFHEDLMLEFNSLAVVYGQMSENFVDEENRVKLVIMKADCDSTLPENGHTNVLPAEDPIGVQDIQQQVQQISISSRGAEIDLLGFMNDTIAPTRPPSSITLNPNAVITGERYQQVWAATSDVEATTVVIPLKFLPAMNEIETAFNQAKILTMASGELSTEFKFFLFAQEPDGGVTFLLQVIITKPPSDVSLSVTVKTDSETNQGVEKSHCLIDTVKGALARFI